MKSITSLFEVVVIKGSLSFVWFLSANTICLPFYHYSDAWWANCTLSVIRVLRDKNLNAALFLLLMVLETSLFCIFCRIWRTPVTLVSTDLLTFASCNQGDFVQQSEGCLEVRNIQDNRDNASIIRKIVKIVQQNMER